MVQTKHFIDLGKLFQAGLAQLNEVLLCGLVVGGRGQARQRIIDLLHP
jgi:hypothetical protein